nr:hypothetical protein CFP56_30031 [Quercus suber]
MDERDEFDEMGESYEMYRMLGTHEISDCYCGPSNTNGLPVSTVKSTSTKKPCRLLALPAELRNMIWSLTFFSSGAVQIRTRRDFTLPALLKVCRSIRNDALQLYYSVNVFEFPIHAWAVVIPRDWLKFIGHANIALLENVQIRFDWMSARTQLVNFSSEKYWRNTNRNKEARRKLKAFARTLAQLGVDLDKVSVVMGGGWRESNIGSRPDWMKYFWRDMLDALNDARKDVVGNRDRDAVGEKVRRRD